MKEYRDFKKSVDFTDWVQDAASEVFTSELRENVSEAHAGLLAACAVSSDPKVTAKLATWKTLHELTTFLENSRKESVTDDD